MRRGRLLTVLLLFGCGARTPLLPGTAAQSDDSSASGGGSSVPLAVPCSAMLLQGAPTPIQGYCPTRANQAAFEGPHAPQIVWSVAPFAIPEPENFLPAAMVVDATGRAYVSISASPQNTSGEPNVIFALEGDGSVAWTSTFVGGLGDMALGSDGRLWIAGQGDAFVNPACTPSTCPALFALSTEGAVVAALNPFPWTDPAVLSSDGFLSIASDGTFFLGPAGGNQVARVAVDGSILWEISAPVERPLVVGPSDDVIAAASDTLTGGLAEYDSSGSAIWNGAGANDASPFAVDAQGDVVALLAGGADGTSLETLGAEDGTPLLEVAIPSAQPLYDATQLAVAGNGTTVVLLANEGSSPGLTKAAVQIIAVDRSGNTLWTTPLDVTLPFDPATLATHYGLFVDAAGTVVVTAGQITGLDLVGGEVLWTLQPPDPTQCLRPAVLGAGGAILASQCDGTVFLARDP